MMTPQKTQFGQVEINSFEFYRLRANQERQMAMKSFFGTIFGDKK